MDWIGLDGTGWDMMGWDLIGYIRIFKDIVDNSRYLGFVDIYKDVLGDLWDILYMWYILVHTFGIFW